MSQQLNPAWTRHNDLYNEGGEGFNPHAKYTAAKAPTKAPARMIAGKMRTQADALKFARNCLSGGQRAAFEAEVARAFGGWAMRYVTYTRTADGIVSRTHGRVIMPARERAAEYPHREQLQGWPERSVYWTHKTGPALGVAPLR